MFKSFFLPVLLLASFIMVTGASRKVLLKKPADPLWTQSCLPNSNGVLKQIPPKTLPPLGTITAGSCVDEWSSGVNFSNAWVGIKTGKVNDGCDINGRRFDFHVNYALPNNRNGVLETFDCAPATATANPCVHTDGETYFKCDAVDGL
jgi:hypothetical protein